jgi:flagellar biosynthesis chaperone FliJ
VDAKKEEKVLQKLKEKEYEMYKVAVNKEETKILDEIPLQKEIRNKNEERR